MQNDPSELGQRRSVHRASLGWLWLLLLCLIPLLIMTVLAILFAFDSLVPGRSNSQGSLSGPLVCAGGSGLLLALVGGLCLSDFRKWSATRTVQLVIYQSGFTYECKGRVESCSWEEIEQIDFRPIEVKSKHSAPRRVSVIRSIVKTDGTVIGLAGTLNLQRITGLIKAAAKNVLDDREVSRSVPR